MVIVATIQLMFSLAKLCKDDASPWTLEEYSHLEMRHI